jgi:hypothetical protein
VGLKEDEDQEGGYTMEAILRSRGYPEDMIEQILARKNARHATTESD